MKKLLVISFSLFVGLTYLLFHVSQFAFSQDSSESLAQEYYQQGKAIMMQASVTREDMEEALRLISEAQRLSPNNFIYAYGVGYANAQLDNWLEAEKWFETALTLADDESDIQDTQAWLGKCSDEKIYLTKAEDTGSIVGDTSVRLTFALKSDIPLDEDHNDKLRTPRCILPKVSVRGSDEPLRRFFSEKLSNLNMIKRDIFFIVGPYSEQGLDRHYERGLKDAYRIFKREYFNDDQEYLITIVISDDPYELVSIVERMYAQVSMPVYAPFLGLFSAADSLVVATIGGGYGTLLHELMHALITADYPRAPGWLDEGMATLYERSKWTRTRLIGLPNWRMEFVGQENIPTLKEFDQMLRRRIKTKYDLAYIRLLMLFLDQKAVVNQFYQAQKAQQETFKISETLKQFGEEFSEAEWQKFAQRTIRDYETELNLERGKMSYNDTLFVQRALNKIMNAGLKEDGIWGSTTEAKVKEFQRKYNLQVDGKVGKNTRAALEREFGFRTLKK